MDVLDELDEIMRQGELDNETADYEVLDKNCFGKITVSAKNWRMGGGKCTGCDKRSECVDAIKSRYSDFIESYNCLGRTDCSPHIEPKGCSSRCKLNWQCYNVRVAVWYSKDQPIHMKQVIKLEYLTDSTPKDVKELPVVIEKPLVPSDTRKAEVKAHILPIAESDPPIKTTIKPSSGYQFPSGDDFEKKIDQYRHKSLGELKAVLIDISQREGAATFDSLRLDYCAVGIALNERQAFLPVLRPRIFVSRKISKGSAASVASNDCQVIDLHWLYSVGLDGVSERWSRIFNPVFDFTLAARFVETVGSTENKAGELRLSRKEMLALAVISDPVTRARKSDIRALLNDKGGEIKTRLGHPRSRQQCSAGEMIQTYHSLLLADLDISSAILVMKNSFDVVVNDLAMRRRKKWLLDQKLLYPIAPAAVSAMAA